MDPRNAPVSASPTTSMASPPGDAAPRPYSGSRRGLAWGAALVLILGSLLFLTGGRAHPGIDASLGAGADGFFRAFADKVRQTHGWHGMHMLILVGPLFWAVAAPTLLDALRPQARTLTSAARSALLLSGALWAVAFVLDGFGAPVYAEAIGAASSPEVADAVLASFGANAVMMTRLGLVSWTVGGLGMVLLAASLLAPDTRTPWRSAVGVAGVVIGVWPLLAAIEGEYASGPFTSRFWMWNALAAGLWYVALATCAFGRGVRGRA